jgi:hypothetical protein
MRPQIVIDSETTSLFPDYAAGSGVIWELALIERDCGAERLYRMEPDTTLADQTALAVGRFDERTKAMKHSLIAGGSDYDGGVTDIAWTGFQLWSNPADLAPHVGALLDEATLIAANPAFDAGFLAAFLAAYDCEPKWHYRLRDIGSMAWAWLQAHHLPHHLATPAMDASTDEFARAMGVDPDEFDRHTALGDCRLVDAMLRVMEGGAS